ncbi:MAG: adenylosuccinate lyase [Parcubacteria group bacterium Gr01-1014_30]|nr:MAG: adenylosuccinate lyase [Parcubacteria group bacterium Gr01-1014_30]
MSIHPIDYRYGSPEMRKIFDEEVRLNLYLKVEAALTAALAELGKIPKEVAREIRKKANVRFVKLARVKVIERETKHDLMAVVKALTEVSGISGKYVHLAATSYDIVDTAQALQTKEALDVILTKGKKLLKSCLTLAKKHKDLIMVGRTHGQHALPITFGFKFANYADKIGNDLEALRQNQKNIVGKFSGAVGTFAAQQVLGINGQTVEKKIMGKLGLKAADISTQVAPRENIARVVCDLAILAGTCEQIAKEIRNLQRTEIAEVSEPFGEKQVGSSAMPQKRNPVDAENVCGNCRVIRSCVGPALENIALEHERDLTNSAAERSLLPTIFVLMDDVLERMNKVVKGLKVFPENMKKNLELTKGAIMAEALTTELTKRGMVRQKAHDILRKSSHKALSKNIHLKEVLAKNKEVLKYLEKKELEKIMDYKKYTGLSTEKTEQIIKKWQNF